MEQLLSLAWWFSFFPQSAAWWIYCVVVSFAALPLCLHFFRGLTDKGAGLSIGVGIIFTTFLSWMLSLEWFTAGGRSALPRLMWLAVACGLFCVGAVVRKRAQFPVKHPWTAYVPAVCVAFIAIAPIPHGIFSALGGIIITAILSAVCWLNRPEDFRWRLRQNATPFIISHLIFFIAFLFFVNVRSYIPYATFELSLYQAEKWGNYTHLNSIMHSSFMPPKDLWFNRWPTNYYYGGHLVTATIAKATGTPLERAFNLGLASLFASTMSMGYSFSMSLVHMATRKIRLRRAIWHSGVAWGLLGMFAIGMFGNLDPFRQLFTRGVDYNVRSRLQHRQRGLQEEWKIRTGVPVPLAFAVYGATQRASLTEKPEALAVELARQEASAFVVGDDLAAIAKSAEEELARLRGKNATPNEIESALRASIMTDANLATLRNNPAVNAEELEEKSTRDLLLHRFDEFVARIKKAASRKRPDASSLDALATKVNDAMKAAVNSPEVAALLKLIADPEYADDVQESFGMDSVIAERSLRTAVQDTSYGRAAAALDSFKRDVASDSDHSKELKSALEKAAAQFDLDTDALLREAWGDGPPTDLTEPGPNEIRFTWDNVTQIDFWAPSRAIKSSPSGENIAGTITEFPYFSAILGDHHPHHMAIPYSLAALAACLSLLRKNARLKRDGRAFLARSWPELVAMAFFIGVVFSVNIWDSVVLAPIYGIVVSIAMGGVRFGEGWRWVGFAGMLGLLTLVISVLYNSMPGVPPLFQSFDIWVCAFMAMCGAMPVLLFLKPERKKEIVGSFLIFTSVLIAFSVMQAPGEGGVAPAGKFLVIMRDVAAWLVIAGLAAYWTLLDSSAFARRWYATGAVYAFVGGLSLLFVAPFKVFFDSPLSPQLRLFAETLPPILSYDIVSAKDAFWDTFWRASPINPFPAELRTQMRDFFMHWGIFMIPICLLTVRRLFAAVRSGAPGFAFMMIATAAAIAAVTRDYLGYWPGALSLAMSFVSLWFAVSFRRRADGPVWAFLAGAFFWTWFVEALHFDDEYVGSYERYNTPFKIYYPLWAIFAGAMTVSLREVFARAKLALRPAAELVRSTEFWAAIVILGIAIPVLCDNFLPPIVAKIWFVLFWIPASWVIITAFLQNAHHAPLTSAGAAEDLASRTLSRWPAPCAAIVVLCLGMYYPLAATITRTREFFTWPMAGAPDLLQPQRAIFFARTLDALAHYKEFPQYRQDWKATQWLKENAPRDATILERPAQEVYSQVGRISTGSGLASVLSWGHHEKQWRGWGKEAPPALRSIYYQPLLNKDEIFRKQQQFDKEVLKDLRPAFEAVLPGIQEPIPADAQRALRLAGDAERLRILRQMFPRASLEDLYRLRRAVEKNSISMINVTDEMAAELHEMYKTRDREKAQKLFSQYHIGYVVFGEVERTFPDYGQDVMKHFLDWGFTKVYDSSEQLLPDESFVDKPTIILKTPNDFASSGESARQ